MSVLRPRHDDDELRRAGVRRVVLAAGDDPLVAVLDGLGGEHLRVGAGVRLGHREAREALAVEQRLEVQLLLLVGAVVGDDLGVAGVGGGGAEHDRRPVRAAEDLVDQRQLELAEALAAEFRAEVRGPQAARLDLLAQRADVDAEVALERVVRELRIQQVERLRSARCGTRGSTPAVLRIQDRY